MLVAQETQSFVPPPEHELQLEWHAWQRELESAYVPSGHVLMHDEEWRMGVLPLSSQDVQLVVALAHV